MERQIFDYSKYSPSDYTYYGFHLKNGRYHIDTKRLKKLKLDAIFPQLLNSPRNTHYFIPKKKYENEYAINILLHMINKLKDDWENEYKVAIAAIKTPAEVMKESRNNQLLFMSSVDDLEDIEYNTLIDGIKRKLEYEEVIKSIHLQYIQKICTEYLRSILVIIKKRGYTNENDFKFNELLRYVSDKLKVKKDEINPIYKLENFKYFDALNRINNFIKHNTRRSYLDLASSPNEKDLEIKKFLSGYVISENNRKYENGMYAGNWLKIDASFIDSILMKLELFSKELCSLLYKEDYEEAIWNSDEFLIKKLKNEIIYLI